MLSAGKQGNIARGRHTMHQTEPTCALPDGNRNKTYLNDGKNATKSLLALSLLMQS
jgi:hypothetical protein